VVILTLNPGFSKNDYEFHRSPDFSKDLRDNLEHKTIEFPFYYLNEKYKECGGYKYWFPFLEEVIKSVQNKVESPVKTIANKVAVLEWFPNHSARFEWKFSLCGLESQKYSHWLAKECLSNPEKVIVIHRSYKLWEDTLGPLDKCITHKSGRPTRLWYLTQYNLKDGDFDRICEAILR
jgi:hypothetical protein